MMIIGTIFPALNHPVNEVIEDDKHDDGVQSVQRRQNFQSPVKRQSRSPAGQSARSAAS